MDRKPPAPLARRLLLGALLGLALVAAAHAALWRHMAAELEQGWQSWVQLRRAQGWRVEHGPAARGGWPAAATLTIERVRIEGMAATLPGGAALAADRVVLRLVLPWLDRLQVDLPGQQRLRLGAAEFPFTADRLAALIPLEPGANAAEVEADRLRIGTPAGAVEVRRVGLATQGSASATEAEAALAVTLSAEGVDLPGGVEARPFGRRVEALSADLSISGPLPAGRAPALRAEAWREGGGTLELRTLSLRWGPVAATAAATLALDETLQPMGAGTLRLTGAREVLDALAEAGLVGGRAAQAARAMLPLLSRPSAADGRLEIEVAVTLEDRLLALARIPVIRFAPLAWPPP